MRPLATLLAPLTLACAVTACTDDAKTPSPDTRADTTAPADGVTPDDTADATSAETTSDTSPDALTCEHPCLNEQGRNDRSLCPDPKADWLCTAGCCTPVFKCQVDADCAEQGFVERQCDDRRFDCRCDAPTGTCFSWYCTVGAECAGDSVCAGGACIAPPDASTLSLRIVERTTVLTPGATYPLHAELFDPNDTRIVLGTSPAWSSSNSRILAVADDGTVTGGSVEGVATITATSNGKTATLALENVTPGAGITLIVRDAPNGTVAAPITGSYLVDTGAGVGAPIDIPADGVITIAAEHATVHVLALDHDWVSWAGLQTGDIRYVPLERTVSSTVDLDADGKLTRATTLHNSGVIAGTPDFTSYSYEGTLEIVLTTAGLSSALFDFNLNALLGVEVHRYLDPNAQIPQVDVTDPLDVPGGIVFNLMGPAIPNYVLTLPAGRHHIWSLGGRLDINDIAEYSQILFDAIGGGPLDFTQIVGAVFPLFRNFWSGFERDVTVELADATTPTLQPYTSRLTTPMGLRLTLNTPSLPALVKADGTALGWADGLFLLSGAETADGFIVPLGLNGGADTSDKTKNPPDGKADANERTPEIDPFILPAAPLHSGLQGPTTRYVAALIAAAIPVGSQDPRPSAGAVTLLRWEPGVRPPAQPEIPDFIGFDLNGGCDFTTRKVAVASPQGADTMRILVKGRHGGHWTVYGLDGGVTFTFPEVPASLNESDRFTEASADSVLVNAIDLAPSAKVSDVGRPGGMALDLLVRFVDRVSFIDVKRMPLP